MGTLVGGLGCFPLDYGSYHSQSDSQLYSEAKVSADNVSYYKNPFVPNNDNGTNHLVGMKPAPSNDTVYYLVEQDGDLDWDSLPDADVKQPSAKQDSDDTKSGGTGGKVASSSELPGPALYNTESDSDLKYTFYSGTGY